MRQLVCSWLFLLVWKGVVETVTAGDDGFAAVPGTGWVDIRDLQSTCNVPGYFVNPSDCSRFYQCVDHSTPEKRLYLRYDFECAAGTAFDEANRICNFPGPNGCITGGGWGSGWGAGWSKPSRLWQATQTVTKVPSWGSPPSKTIVVSSTTPAPPLPSNPRVVTPAVGFESFRIRNPGTSGVFQRVRVSTEAPPVDNGGWTESPPRIVNNPVIFQSAKVTASPPPSKGWTASKLVPVQSPIFQSARVTPIPRTEWENIQPFPIVQEGGPGWAPPPPIQITPTPLPVPVNPIRIIEGPTGGWSADPIRINASPSPIPSNPAISYPVGGNGVIYNTISSTPAPPPSPIYQNNNQLLSPGPFWDWLAFNRNPQPNNPVSSGPFAVSTTPSPSPAAPSSGNWQGARVIQTQGQQPVRYTWSPPQVVQAQSQQISLPQQPPQRSANIVAANPSISGPSPPAGWQNVKLTQLPSGYSWQTTGPASQTAQITQILRPQQQNQLVEGQDETGNDDGVQSLQTGNFGIIQQVIDEQQGSGEMKTHIQRIYDKKEKNDASLQNVGIGNQVQNQGFARQVGVAAIPQPQLQQQQQQIQQSLNEVQQGSSSKNPSSNPVFEIGPESGIKGRIIVLYAPLNKGGKRDVPVIEVQLDDDGNIESVKNEENYSNK